MSELLKLILMLALLGPASALAADLQQAKNNGLVGEQLNGYLGLVSAEASAEVRALIADVNSKRKAKYQSIAAQNNAGLKTVELLAGKKAIEKTRPGNYIQSVAGWRKK